MCVGLGERAVALWHVEQLITSRITASAGSGMDGYVEELVTVCIYMYGGAHVRAKLYFALCE